MIAAAKSIQTVLNSVIAKTKRRQPQDVLLIHFRRPRKYVSQNAQKKFKIGKQQ